MSKEHYLINTHFRAQRIAGHNEELQIYSMRRIDSSLITGDDVELHIYSMRKETPLDSNSDSLSEISENKYSDWRRETPIEFEETLEMEAGNEEAQIISETICSNANKITE